MSHRIVSAGSALLFLILLGSMPARAESTCQPDALQDSGSIYRICMPAPEDYNNRLFIWAHGFQDAGTPVEIPESQLGGIEGASLPVLANDFGFGFATNSYSKTGLAIRQGMEDILDLVEIYAAEQGVPEKVYLIGASEGGIITTLLIEGYPDVFDAGIAACGPVGDFAYQINYFGNARATFEYFFPGLILGDPFDPPVKLTENWSEYYEDVVQPTVFSPENERLLSQWARVAKLPVDRNDRDASLQLSVRDALRYAVVNLNDARETLGGFPFDNTNTFYFGSFNDFRLNRDIERVAADEVALLEMDQYYDTTGDLQTPLMTIHTTQDQQVPHFHEPLYLLKTLRNGSFLRHHLNFTVERYGHCDFTLEEAVFSLAVALVYAGDAELLPGLLELLPTNSAEAVEKLAADEINPRELQRALPR